MSVNPLHKQLLRETLRGSHEDQRKKRRRVTPAPHPDPVPPEKLPLEEPPRNISELDSESDLEFEDVSTEKEQTPQETAQVGPSRSPSQPESRSETNDFNSDSDSFDDLEDVDIDAMFSSAPPQEEETLNITIHNATEEDDATKKGTRRRKAVIVLKEERHRRKLVHKLYLMVMISHGVVRNRWCNDYALQVALQTNVPPEITDIFNKNKSKKAATELDYVKLRRFIEGMRRLCAWWGKKFRVMAQGLVRKDWPDLLVQQECTCGRVDQDRFRSLVSTQRGNRDIGAQGFVSLARSLGVHARLVFSLQPPDFKSITEKPKEPEEEEKLLGAAPATETPKSEFDPVFIPDPKAGLLHQARSKITKSSRTHRPLLKQKYTFPVSSFPIFWCEVWNPYTRKWLTVDPIVNHVVEVMPSRKKCKFEAPASDPTHQTLYVIAYDRYGGVRDVTRRYTQYYNARTSKRRIDSVSVADEHWYEQIMKAARTSTSRYTESDILESKEFHERDISEGVPNNMTDFKNHPVYALETQLRQDEVIYPKNDTSKCGTFRPMNKNTVMPVYKRSHVFQLRSPKAWYLRGRVLKIGAQPLKTKEKQASQLEDDDDDGKVRLYAEFQTELYRPPAIEDGKIVKNAYGNVEIFTPTMKPDNGYLIKVLDSRSIKILEAAARILKIDYARAIVSFDFGGDSSNKKSRVRTPKAKVGGILVDVQYKEAIDLVVEQLVEQEKEEERMKVELTALRAWSFFLKKLVVINRLDRVHGEVPEDDNEARSRVPEIKEEDDEDDGYFSVESDGSDGGDQYVQSGSREERAKRRAALEDVDDEEDEELGGFLMPSRESTVEQDSVDVPQPPVKVEEEGGFIVSSKEQTPVQEVDQEIKGEAEDIEFDGGGGFFVDSVPEVKEEEKEEEQEEEGEEKEEDKIEDSKAEIRDNEGGFLAGTSDHQSESSDELSDEELQNMQEEEEEMGFEYSDLE